MKKPWGSWLQRLGRAARQAGARLRTWVGRLFGRRRSSAQLSHPEPFGMLEAHPEPKPSPKLVHGDISDAEFEEVPPGGGAAEMKQPPATSRSKERLAHAVAQKPKGRQRAGRQAHRAGRGFQAPATVEDAAAPAEILEVETSATKPAPKMSHVANSVAAPPAEVPEVEKTVADAPAELLEVEKTVAEAPAEVPEVENLAAEAPAEVPEVEKTAAAASAEVPEVEKTAAEAPTEVPEVEKTVAEAPAEVPEVEKTVAEAPAEVPEVEKTAADAPAEVPEVEKTAAAAPAEVPEVEKTAAAAPAEVPEVEKTAAEASAEVPEVENLAAAASAEVPEVEKTAAAAPAEVPEVEPAAAAASAEVSDVEISQHASAAPEASVRAAEDFPSAAPSAPVGLLSPELQRRFEAVRDAVHRLTESTLRNTAHSGPTLDAQQAARAASEVAARLHIALSEAGQEADMPPAGDETSGATRAVVNAATQWVLSPVANDTPESAPAVAEGGDLRRAEDAVPSVPTHILGELAPRFVELCAQVDEIGRHVLAAPQRPSASAVVQAALEAVERSQHTRERLQHRWGAALCPYTELTLPAEPEVDRSAEPQEVHATPEAPTAEAESGASEAPAQEATESAARAAEPPVPVNLPPVEIPKDYVPAAESTHELYQVNLGGFTGPLDLLLFLIRRHQLDVLDIPIAFICEKYLEYLKLMEDLNIDIAAEFLFLASELLHIKSKMLLPKPAEVSDEEEGDPRADLVARLLEYQKYRDAAAHLAESTRLGRDVFERPAEKLPAISKDDAPLREVGVFALLKAFDEVLKRQKPEIRHQVVLEQVSVKQRIVAMIDSLQGQESLPFVDALGPMYRRIDIVVTFLAVLEMTRLRMLKVYQSDTGILYLHPTYASADEAMERLQGMDTSLDQGQES